MRVFKSTLAIFLFAALVGSSFALLQSQEDQSAKQDMKDAGHATKNAAKDTGRATKKTAKKTGHAVKRTTKKATYKTAQKTKEGAQKVEDKTNPNWQCCWLVRSPARFALQGSPSPRAQLTRRCLLVLKARSRSL